MDEHAIRALVERSRDGDADAFAALFRHYRDDVGRLATRLLGSRDDADDAVSEVFLRARKALDAYDASRPFRPWLLSIASNLCVDRLRRRSTERRIFAGAEVETEALASPGPSPLERRMTEEARREVLAAIDALPPRYRAPLALRYYAELDYDAIAAALDVSRGQVATLLFRAKRKLRENLAGDDARSRR